MALTAEHRAELEILGPEIVRIRLMASDKVAAISGFATATTRSDVESWLTEKRSSPMVVGFSVFCCRIPCNGGCFAIAGRKESTFGYLQFFRFHWLACRCSSVFFLEC